VAGRGGADHSPHPAQARVSPEPVGEPLDQSGKALVQRLLGRRQVLDVRGAGVAGPHQGEDTGRRRLRGGDQRLQRVAAEQRVRGERIDAQAGDGAPRGRRLADQRLPVGGRGDRYVAALPIGDRQQPGLTRRRADLGQGDPTGRPKPLEAGQLGLDGNAGRAGLPDERTAVRRDGAGRTLGRRGSVGRGVGGELGGVGVEPEADLAAALLDERRQPICKGDRAQPLTLVFNAEPAEKRGTLPPGIVIRSPVRGLTP